MKEPHGISSSVPSGEAMVRQAALQYANAGQFAEARAALSGALLAGLVTAGLLSDLATVQTLLGQLEKSEESLRLALQLRPDDFGT